MKFAALFCAVVLAVEARPQTDPQPQGVTNIAVEYEKYHQLWLAEAKRNSIAPVSLFKTVSNVEEPQVQPQPEAEPQLQPEAEVRAAEPQQVAEVVAEKAVEQEVQPEPVEVAAVVPDMAAAFADFHTLWAAEAARNAIGPTSELKPEPVAVVPAVQPIQTVAEVKQAAIQDELVEMAVPALEDTPAPVAAAAPLAETAAPAVPDYQAEFARFHKLWQQEAARNAIAPVFQHQPVATAPVFQHQPVAVQPVAAPEPVTPVASPSPVSAPLTIPANLFGNLGGGQPIIVLLPNWSPAATPAV